MPWFVAELPDGTRDIRVADFHRMREAIDNSLCWVCGQHVGANKTFVIGPMCAINRVTAEPGCHRNCALYAAMACPFLARPHMRRRDLPPEHEYAEPAGEMLERNPGLAVLWNTRTWAAQRDHGGYLFSLGDPNDVEFFHRGRRATREEVLEAFVAGRPALEEAARKSGPMGMVRLGELTGVALRVVDRFLPV